jgi:cholesterol oxidase
MLGVNQYPHVTEADKIIREVADDMGVGDTFVHTPVGVFFGEPDKEVDDPYFGGAGPRRTGCTECGACMTGCRVGAKNTLDKNYLYFAEKLGAEIHPMTTVVDVRPRPRGGYVVETRRTNGRIRRGKRSFTAERVVFAAGTYNTQKLLHRLKASGRCPTSPTGSAC